MGAKGEGGSGAADGGEIFIVRPTNTDLKLLFQPLYRGVLRASFLLSMYSKSFVGGSCPIHFLYNLFLGSGEQNLMLDMKFHTESPVPGESVTRKFGVQILIMRKPAIKTDRSTVIVARPGEQFLFWKNATLDLVVVKLAMAISLTPFHLNDARHCSPLTKHSFPTAPFSYKLPRCSFTAAN